MEQKEIVEYNFYYYRGKKGVVIVVFANAVAKRFNYVKNAL